MALKASSYHPGEIDAMKEIDEKVQKFLHPFCTAESPP
jgi:hypothetical protein